MYRIKPLKYTADGSRWVDKLLALNLEWPIWFDSCRPYSDQGTLEIISAAPHTKILAQAGQVFSLDKSGRRQNTTLDPFSFIQQQLDFISSTPTTNEQYFYGGALGYFGYGLGPYIEPSLPQPAIDELSTVPDMAIGLYDWAIVIDHQRQESYWACSKHNHTQSLALYDKLMAIAESPPYSTDYFRLKTPFESNLSFEAYMQRFKAIKDYIAAGDCYQINLTQRFATGYSGSPFQAYLSLRRHNPAPFAGFMDIGDTQLLSLSPERFLRVQGDQVITQPIKGTIASSPNPSEDLKQQQQLLNSHKDRAENTMIVDLMRNDLGRSCLPGSVAVPKLCELQSFKGLHHLVSTVQGQLAPQQSRLELFKNAFPGGSITGAPKIRAMQIIDELEPHNRSLHYGSLGYIGYNGQTDSNIMIRSLLCHQNRIYSWAGGGIVADSDGEQEYQECFNKIKIIHQTLNGCNHDDQRNQSP